MAYMATEDFEAYCREVAATSWPVPTNYILNLDTAERDLASLRRASASTDSSPDPDLLRAYRDHVNNLVDDLKLLQGQREVFTKTLPNDLDGVPLIKEVIADVVAGNHNHSEIERAIHQLDRCQSNTAQIKIKSGRFGRSKWVAICDAHDYAPMIRALTRLQALVATGYTRPSIAELRTRVQYEPSVVEPSPVPASGAPAPGPIKVGRPAGAAKPDTIGDDGVDDRERDSGVGMRLDQMVDEVRAVLTEAFAASNPGQPATGYLSTALAALDAVDQKLAAVAPTSSGSTPPLVADTEAFLTACRDAATAMANVQGDLEHEFWDLNLRGGNTLQAVGHGKPDLAGRNYSIFRNEAAQNLPQLGFAAAGSFNPGAAASGQPQVTGMSEQATDILASRSRTQTPGAGSRPVA